MKNISLVLACIATISCGKKGNISGTRAITATQQVNKSNLSQQDSDLDGVSDIEEERIGTNPNIANLPDLSFTSIGDSLFQARFFDRTTTSQYREKINFSKSAPTEINWYRSLIADMAYNELIHEPIDFKYHSLSNLGTKVFKCLTKAESKKSIARFITELREKEYINKYLKFSYRLNIKKMKKLEEIKNIYIDILWNDQQVGRLPSQKLFYQLRNNAFDSKQIYNVINTNEIPFNVDTIDPYKNCLYLKTENFDYSWNGKVLNYKTQLEKIDQSLAHIIIVRSGSLKKYSVNPKAYDLVKLLDELDAKATFSHGGDLVSAFGIGNNFLSLNDLDLSSAKSLKKTKWFYFNKEGKRVIEKLSPGKTYFLANLELKDILKTKKVAETQNYKHKEKLILKDILPGDSISLETSLRGEIIVSEKDRHYLTTGFLVVMGKEATASAKNMCVVKESNTFPNGRDVSLMAEDVDYYPLKIGSRKIQAKIVRGKLIYEFDVHFQDLVNGDLDILLPRESSEEVNYKRLIHRYDKDKSLRCVSGTKRTNSKTFKNRRGKLVLEYETTVTRRGIYRN